MSVAPDRREGTVLAGKYQLEHRLGAGGMGEVYRATNLLIGRTVAIKLLKVDLAQQPDIVARFLREARAANLVRHPNVVDVLDVAQDDAGVPFIVQEFLEGCDLADAMNDRGGRLPVHAVLQLLIPVFDAVGNAHAKGVVHRDLKPENVFLAQTEGGIVAKVLDFGISKVMSDGEDMRLTATGASMGTPAYMSPEQIRRTRHVDARTDVWAIGVILHEVLSGRLPFEAETQGDLFVKICTEKPTPLDEHAPDVPADFAWIIEKCLRMDPDSRYANASEIARDLQLLVPRFGRGPAFKLPAQRARAVPSPQPLPATEAFTPPGSLLQKHPAAAQQPTMATMALRGPTPPGMPAGTPSGQFARVTPPVAAPVATPSNPGDAPFSGTPSMARRIYRGDIELDAGPVSNPGVGPSPDASLKLAAPIPNRPLRKASIFPTRMGGEASGAGERDGGGFQLFDAISFALLAAGLAGAIWMALHTGTHRTPGVIIGRFFYGLPTLLRWVVSTAIGLGGLGLAQRSTFTKPPRWGFLVAGGGLVLFGVCAAVLTASSHWHTLALGGRPAGLATVLFPWGAGLLFIGLGSSLLYASWERWRYGEGLKPVAAAIAAAAIMVISAGLWIGGVGARRVVYDDGYDGSETVYSPQGTREYEPPPDPNVTMAPPRVAPPRATAPSMLPGATAATTAAPSAAPERRRRHRSHN